MALFDREACWISAECAVSREQRKNAAQAAAARAAAHRAQQGASKSEKGGKGQCEREETCAVCQCEFTVAGDTGEGICCPSSHFLCCECTGVFVQSIMNDLAVRRPHFCPTEIESVVDPPAFCK